MWKWLSRWTSWEKSSLRKQEDVLWLQQLAAVPILQGLDAQEQATLIALARHFLAQKKITPLGVSPTYPQLMALSLQAVLPLLHIGDGWYRNFYELILLPAEVERREMVLQPDGVLIEQLEQHLGEAWEQGPVVLVWPEFLRDGHWDGYHLLIHELLHKLDMLAGGGANGMPPEQPGVPIALWQRIITTHFDACAQGSMLLWLEEQGLENLAEFFAVTGEAFFTSPRRLELDAPDLYQLYTAWFRQDPSRREPAGQTAYNWPGQ